MLDKLKVLEAFETKKSEFSSYNTGILDNINLLNRRFLEMSQYSSDEINHKLRDKIPGALPTGEWDESKNFVKFEKRWSNHQEARLWAYKILIDKITFAVDGSQIVPSKDFYPLVGAVQVALFENFHSESLGYRKEIIFDVISPGEIDKIVLKYPQADAFTVITDYINFKRFELEANTIINYMDQQRDSIVKPLIFFDGALIFSFLIPEKTEEKENYLFIKYIEKIREVLEYSEKCKVPLVGFIDTSKAHDLLKMIVLFNNLPSGLKVTDSQIIDSNMEWGDRTSIFRCKRHGILRQYGEYKDKLGFIYLKTNKNPPARVEFPLWITEDPDYFRAIIDIIRAEIIIGNGYIYPIESADATAVMTTEDKQVFYRLFAEFAFRNNLDISLSQKAFSKSQRR